MYKINFSSAMTSSWTAKTWSYTIYIYVNVITYEDSPLTLTHLNFPLYRMPPDFLTNIDVFPDLGRLNIDKVGFNCPIALFPFSIKSNCHINHSYQPPTTTHINFTLLFLSSLWSDLSMWGHFLIVLNLRKLNLISACATERGNAH